MQTKNRVTLALRPIHPTDGPQPFEIASCPECNRAVRVYETAVTAPLEWRDQRGGGQFGAVYIGECVCGAMVVMAEDR